MFPFIFTELRLNGFRWIPSFYSHTRAIQQLFFSLLFLSYLIPKLSFADRSFYQPSTAENRPECVISTQSPDFFEISPTAAMNDPLD